MPKTSFDTGFSCPSCKAFYRIVKAEAGPETVFGDVPCWICCEPLAGCSDGHVLKYFLLRSVTRTRKTAKKTEQLDCR